MTYKDILIKLIFINGTKSEKSRRLTSISCKIASGRYPNILKYLQEMFPNSSCTRELFFRLRYNILERPVCPACGKPVKFIGHIDSSLLYAKHCSHSCSRKDKTVLEKTRTTSLERYGEHNLTNREKCKQTCLEKYGVDNVWKLDEIQKKCKETIISNHGSLYVKEKVEQTCLEKYGTKQVLANKEIREKGKQTCLKKYGVDHPMKATEILDKYDWESIVEKVYKTKKRNNSFRNTKPEQEIYKALLEKYPIVEREYKSEKYPFMCDFYIPEEDLYIEYNGYWTHGKHRFDSTNGDDVKILKTWKEKSKTSKQYQNAIETWTKRDILKYETAKNNNLKYLTFYNIEEFYTWYNGIR